MSIFYMSSVWKHSKHKGSELLCLLAIADCANDEGYAWPSMDTISRKTRQSIRNTQYLVDKLVVSGELQVEKGAGRNGTNLYYLPPVHSEPANFAPPPPSTMQTSDARLHPPPAKQRRQIAPNPSGTVIERSGTISGDSAPENLSPHTEFIQGWMELYRIAFGRDYVFQGGKDAAQVKRLLVASKLTPEQLLAIANGAWQRPEAFNCKQAVTISGFLSRFNEIRQEIETARKKVADELPPIDDGLHGDVTEAFLNGTLKR
jgi:hypothetical protein